MAPDLHQIDAVAMIVARARKRRLRSIPVPAQSKPSLPRKGAEVVRLPVPGGHGSAPSGRSGGGTPKGAA